MRSPSDFATRRSPTGTARTIRGTRPFGWCWPVGPAAIELELIKPAQDLTKIAIRAVNTNALIEANVFTSNGRVCYSGNTSISGISRTAAAIALKFKNLGGEITGKICPTGSVIEEIEGIKVTCLDLAMPMIIARAEDFGKTGYETKQELDRDRLFFEKLESIRRIGGERMGLGDVSKSIIPKFSIIAPPRHQGNITSRYFVPDFTHPSHALSGAICLSYCCLLKDSIASQIAVISDSNSENIIVEHPSGELEIKLKTNLERNKITLSNATVIRTARLLYSDYVYIPIE